MARLKLPHLRALRLPPPLSYIPRPALHLIALLIFINCLVWAGVGITLHYFSKMISPAVLSYTLGLRHALDADHISAIDLMTRRLIATGQRPVAVGTFFSLGHSTIVIITCIVVAATSGALRNKFDNFQRVGGIIGTSVSAAFLIVLGVGNGWVLYKLVKRLRVKLKEQRERRRRVEHGEDLRAEEEQEAMNNLQLEGAGFLARVFRRVFAIVDRPWKMYPLGVLFGLGFDTSSEIALLGIASIQAVQGTSIWLILIFPILFTAGMCMLDTTDGALMMALYTSKAFSRDVVAILYYSIVLTGITVVVSAFIGVIQILSLAYNVAEPTGRFWDGVEAIGDHYDVIGGCICGLFVVVGLASVLVYRPWRKKMEDRMNARSILDVESPVASPAAVEDGDRGVISPYADSPVVTPLERVPERIV
ncbi:high-affinity nickel-transport protein-domain-containing protein [Copromyces sp. CBS 386.78]|nr:high-affinity nickel-transport protein-domain-containing protein [Copromyces sp. CBS 386.78]